MMPDATPSSSRAWECVTCGEMIDSVTIRNRFPDKKRQAHEEHTHPPSSIHPIHLSEHKEKHAPIEYRPQVPLPDCSHHECTIMTVLHGSSSLPIEEILERVTDLSWSQIFLTIRGLSRKGSIALHRHGFTYTVEKVHRSSVKGETNGQTASDY
ncbi:hypothetical protein [Petrachloros mirabilis]